MKEKNKNKCRCFFVVLFSIIFIVRLIKETIHLVKIIPDFEEQKSDLVVQYRDQRSMEESFISFTNFNPELLNTNVFSKEITEANWEPKNERKNVDNITNLFNNKCEKCGTEYFNPAANSSKRDLIITYFTGLSSFKLRFISSLRSVGCQATIALFITKQNVQASPILNSVVDNCGVLVFQIADFLDPYSINKEISYHILAHEFLKEYRSDFDRVIIFDSTSIIVQSDPFTTYFTYNTVGVTTANYTKQISYDESYPINSIDSNYNSEFYVSRAPFLKSSIIFGSVDGILMFYGIIFGHKNFAKKLFDNDVSFSTYINYYYHRGIFEKEGLKLLIAIPGSSICLIENSNQLKTAANFYYQSPLDVKRKNYYTLKYYREKHIIHTIGISMNPPSLIAVDENDPFASIHFLGCSNIQYKGSVPIKRRVAPLLRNRTHHHHQKER